MKRISLLFANVCVVLWMIQVVQAAPPSIRFMKSEMVFPVGTEVPRFRPVNDAAETGGAIPTDRRYSEVSTLTYKPPTTAAEPGHDDGDIAASKFQGPQGLVLDQNGNLYIAERYGHRIRKIDFSTGKTTTVAGDNSKDTGDKGLVDGEGTNARFNEPTDMAFDSQGNLFVVDRGNNCIRKITPTGTVSLFAGSPAGTAGVVDGQGSDALFYSPFNIIIDSSDNLYVSDRGNHKIRLISPAGEVSTYIGTGEMGDSDGDATTEASLNNPTGLVMDKDGNIYFADAGNHKVRKYDASTLQVSTVAGNGTAGVVDGQGTAASFSQPIGLALDQYEELYVADFDGRKIRRITPSGCVQTLAGQGGGSFVDNVLPTSAYFRSPADIVYDQAKRCLWIADNQNHAIRRVHLTGFNMTPTIPSTEWGINMLVGEIYCNLNAGLKPTVQFPATDFVIWGFNTDGGSSTQLRITVPPEGTVVHLITSEAGVNGQITASKDIISGNSATFQIMPDENYEIDRLLVDGASVPPTTAYTFNNVIADATISVTFKSADTGIAAGIENEQAGFKLYPTLLEGNTLYVQVVEKASGRRQAMIRSIDGRVVHTQNIEAGPLAEIRLPEISKGLYLFEITGVGSAIFMKK